MKKKLLGIVAASAFAIAAIGAPMAADQGGVPNADSCHGAFVSWAADVFGNTKDAAAGLGFDSVKEYQAFLKDLEDTGGGQILCALIRYDVI